MASHVEGKQKQAGPDQGRVTCSVEEGKRRYSDKGCWGGRRLGDESGPFWGGAVEAESWVRRRSHTGETGRAPGRATAWRGVAGKGRELVAREAGRPRQTLAPSERTQPGLQGAVVFQPIPEAWMGLHRWR